MWPKTDRQRQLVGLAGELADRFALRAEEHDRAGTFPHENVADLHASGYLSLTIPREFGGGGVSILEASLAQERLARGDASTALGVSMHLSILGRLGRAVVEGNAAESSGWDRERYHAVARAVIDEGALVNSAASEPSTGSPSRGGRPATTAHVEGDFFVLDGRKTFTTMAPALTFMLVSATIETAYGEEAGQFLVHAGTPGVRIEETWDAVGMRASGSHDLVLEGVRVPRSALLSRRPYPSTTPASEASPASEKREPAAQSPAPGSVEPSAVPSQRGTERQASAGPGWASLIPAVYLGVATAAREAAVQFARDRRPQPLGGRSIGELPSVQRLIGEMEIALLESRSVLFGVVQEWVEAPDRRTELLPLLSGAKYIVTNRAVEITDKAMRVVGGVGLSRSHPVQRYYRDVRAGLYHPPMDDVALTALAKAALDETAAGH